MNEIDQTKKILEKNPVEALARAYALKDNTKGFDQVEGLYTEAGSRAKGEFDIAVSSGRWTDALVIYRSLTALSIAPKGWSETKLLESRVRAWEAMATRHSPSSIPLSRRLPRTRPHRPEPFRR